MTKIAVRQRIEWIDLAKGVTMLLVILGHSVFGNLRGAIFSFHMPLFFILSCMTYRLSTDGAQLWKKTQKAFTHLVIPALILFVLDLCARIAIEVANGTFRGGWEFWQTKLLTLFFASGSAVNAHFPITHIPIERMGIPWFLIVLFMGRTLLDLLHLKLGRWYGPVCMGLSVAGVVIGQYCWLPLSFDVMLVSLLFLLIGCWLRQYDFEKRSLLRFVIALALWFGTMKLLELGAQEGDVRNYLELSARKYPLYPLCILTAVSGTMMVAYISTILVRLPAWMKGALMFIGEHSLMMLCVHTLDYLWERIYLSSSGNPLIRAAVRIAVDLAIFVIVVYIKKMIGKWRCKK